MKKFGIEASETHVYRVFIEADNYEEATEKFWEMYPDLKPADIRDAEIDHHWEIDNIKEAV